VKTQVLATWPRVNVLVFEGKNNQNTSMNVLVLEGKNIQNTKTEKNVFKH
jgi:hypothetical protein